MLTGKKRFPLIMAICVAVATLSTPNTAEAWFWFVAKQVFKSSKPSPKSMNRRDSDYNFDKYSQGWEADRSAPDWKKLNYREKDWYD